MHALGGSSTPGQLRPSPEYSIILPTRNRPDFLAKAIDSVLVQTNPNWELIVIDDASARPAKVPDDPRVQLLRRDHAGGPAVARNAGLALARGAYVAFLDDDDAYTPDRLEAVSIGRTRHPITTCWIRFAGDPPRLGRRLEGDVSLTILAGPTPSVGATVVRRDICPRFDESWMAVEDVEWWMRLAAVGTVHTVEHVGYVVHRHQGVRKLNGVSARIAESVALLERRDYFDQRVEAESYRWKRIGLMAEASGDVETTRMAYRRAFELSPCPSNRWHRLRSTLPSRLHMPLRSLSRLHLLGRPRTPPGSAVGFPRDAEPSSVGQVAG